MFFFIAGIQPKTVTLEEHPRMCQACGLYQTRLKRVDHYLSLFFLPIFRVKKGESFLQCQSCGSLSDESGDIWSRQSTDTNSTCPYCTQPVESKFRFCPSCGKELETCRRSRS
ncbi:MAG: zinc ribbon domain-containing protein [Deltaproteobacteria bacterium]|nr:zinc ribbon domain-containing protein [Deltaproteobacteria bacterium]